jgi:hypothetical protein
MQSIFNEIVAIRNITSVYTNTIPENIRSVVIKDHKLNSNSEILFLWKVNSDSLVITTTSLSIFFNNDLIENYWGDHNEIRYDLADNCLVLKLNGEYNGIRINREYFGMPYNLFKNDKGDAGYYLANLLNSFIEYAHELNLAYEKAVEEIGDVGDPSTIAELDERELEDYCNKIISIYDAYVDDFGDEVMDYRLKFGLIIALSEKKEFKNCLEEINFVIENFEKDINLEVWYSIKSDTLESLNKDYDAITYLKKAYDLTKNNNDKFKYRDQINEIQTRYNDSFLDLPIENRKLILIDNDLKSTPEDTFIVLDKNKLPKNIRFPNNTPKNKELYIAHPHIKGSYLPFASYEEQLSTDKFKEFFFFVQCLGAKKITYKTITGISSDEKKDRNFHVDGSLEVGKGFVKSKGAGSYDNDSSENAINKQLNDSTQSQTFTPRKAPYLPNNLLYYPDELLWQWLYQQRLAGGFDSHNEVIISKKSEIINEIEKNNLKVTFKNLFADAEVNVNHVIDQTFKQNQVKKWVIEIEFESIENLKEIHIESETMVDTSDSFSNVEEEYLEEVKYMLEDDGVIDEKERKSLERFRIKKGISAERALELENKLSSLGNLSENENEYLEEFQELINEGEITEKERRTLNRMANRLGISEERVSQLEGLRTV